MKHPASDPGGQPASGAPLSRLLKVRNFRLFWLSQAASLLGVQFYLVALPWLVLQLTGDALATGTVLAAIALPRALLIALGGVLTDRYSPRRLMLASNLFRMALIAVAALAVRDGWSGVGLIYGVALACGIADAFFFPAQNAILPVLVGPGDLKAANALVSATMQSSLFIGPMIAGLIIGFAPQVSIGEGAGPPMASGGIALVLALGAGAFLFSALVLGRLRTGEAGAGAVQGVFAAFGEGFGRLWADGTLRALFVFIALINLLTAGPLFVGLPLLASSRFAEGAAAYGALLSANGGGSLAGSLLAGLFLRVSSPRLGSRLALIISALGVGLMMLSLVPTLAAALAVTALMGTAYGYVAVSFLTWLQLHTPRAMLGRVMGIMMFASVGLQPVSAALAGLLMKFDPGLVMLGAGVLMTAVSMIAAFSRPFQSMGTAKPDKELETSIA